MIGPYLIPELVTRNKFTWWMIGSNELMDKWIASDPFVWNGVQFCYIDFTVRNRNGIYVIDRRERN